LSGPSISVINIDSRYDLHDEIAEYVQWITRSYDQHADHGSFSPVSLTKLINRIPLLIVSDESMPEEGADVDIMGFYMHQTVILERLVPVVGLCMDRIVQACRLDESRARPIYDVHARWVRGQVRR
jgi:hypothetical protein